HARLRIVAEVTAEAEGARAVRRRIELAERITERDRVDPVEGEAARVRGSAVDVAQRRSGHGVPRAVPVTDLAEAAGGRDRLAPVDAHRNPHAAAGPERELALRGVGPAKRAFGVSREESQASLAHGELRAALAPRLHAGHATAELPDRQRPEWDLALQAVANVQRDDGEDPARRGIP